MARVGHGVFEMASDLIPEWNEFDWMGDLSRETGLPVTFTALQSPVKAMSFDDQMANMREQNAKGANILAQISMRGTGLILGWRTTFNPFSFKPSWAEVADLEEAAQLERLADPDFRHKLITEESVYPDSDVQILTSSWRLPSPCNTSSPMALIMSRQRSSQLLILQSRRAYQVPSMLMTY